MAWYLLRPFCRHHQLALLQRQHTSNRVPPPPSPHLDSIPRTPVDLQCDPRQWRIVSSTQQLLLF
jgi:hypothetical protein